MTDYAPTFFLVIPCFRESRRLPVFLSELCPALLESGLDVRVQVVDDGSGELERKATLGIVERFSDTYPIFEDVIWYPENRGKGFAIREGWKRAPEASRFLGFVDADGAVRPSGIVRVMKAAAAAASNKVVIASRRVEGGRVERSRMRGIASRCFRNLVRLSYRIEILDTQCGCKLVPGSWFRSETDTFVEEGFGFDIELLLRVRETGLPVDEVGVDWIEREGSKVGIGKAVGLILDVGLKRIGKR